MPRCLVSPHARHLTGMLGHTVTSLTLCDFDRLPAGCSGMALKRRSNRGSSATMAVEAPNGEGWTEMTSESRPVSAAHAFRYSLPGVRGDWLYTAADSYRSGLGGVGLSI